jgi:hypothetical protein
MEQFSKIFIALSAGAYCLLAYPGIFSGLSNDGKLSPALLYFTTPAALKEPMLFMPGLFTCQRITFLLKQNFTPS